MSRSLFAIVASLAGALPVFVGCSTDSGPAVAGVITLADQPLAGARVVFEPLDKTSQLGGAMAVTDAAGSFSIEPHPQTGETLKLGTYAVSVSRKVDGQGNVPPEGDYPQLEAAGQLRESVPMKYVYPPDGRPELTAIIKEGSNDLQFQLTQ